MDNPLNPAAGSYPYPTDPFELALAERTAAVIWRALPYVRARYGERGWRFTLSDAGWLVVIAGRKSTDFAGQTVWLAGLLSPRGIPSCVMELQLRHLDSLGRRREWRGVRNVAHGLRALRTRRAHLFPDARLLAAARAFEERAGGGRLGQGLGYLVACAHADVELGYCKSPSSVVDWVRGLDVGEPRFREAVAAAERALSRAPR